MIDADRIERERDFHNQRFADDSAREERVGRFYCAIGYGFDLYRQRVSEAAKGHRVLEYGCGTGSLAFDLAGDASHVMGIDISDVAIQHAHENAGQRGLTNVDFRVENAEAMGLPEHQFDVVAGSGIVHHLDIPKAMQEVRRVLAPGGVAIFAEPLDHNPIVRWYRQRTPELRTPDEHPLTIADLRAMSREFTSSRITFFGLVAPVLGLVWRHARAGNPITRFVWWVDRWVCRIPFVKNFAWFCVLEVRP